MKTIIRIIIIWLVTFSILLNVTLWILLRRQNVLLTQSTNGKLPPLKDAALVNTFIEKQKMPPHEWNHPSVSQPSPPVAAAAVHHVPGAVDKSSPLTNTHNHSSLSLSLSKEASSHIPSNTTRHKLFEKTNNQDKILDLMFYIGPGLINTNTPVVNLPPNVILRTFQWNASQNSPHAISGECEVLDYGILPVPPLPEVLTKSWPHQHEAPAQGGIWSPEECVALDDVAILVPYRNRQRNLQIFLPYMHFYLQQQGISYGIYLIEQTDNRRFNRGKLFNAGFVLTQIMHKYKCYILHDIDKLPEDTRHTYTCGEQPLHLINSMHNSNVQSEEDLQKKGFNLTSGYIGGELYKGFFGGVCALKASHYEAINGMINTYWGWGGEDDDLFNRLKAKHFKPGTTTSGFGRYLVLYHKPDAQYSHRPMPKYNLVRRRMQKNGLSTLNFRVVDIQYKPLYTHIMVDLT